jgi:hypothetical protein
MYSYKYLDIHVLHYIHLIYPILSKLQQKYHLYSLVLKSCFYLYYPDHYTM